MEKNPSCFKGTARIRATILAVAAVALMALGQNATALAPEKRVSQYIHTAWRLSEATLLGIPTAITQTTDGYLWIGTSGGLQRFDGVRFVDWKPPVGVHFDSNVKSLLGSSDGSLWIGTRSGLARWKSGYFQEFPECSGLITAIREASDGRIWVTRIHVANKRSPLCSINGDSVKVEEKDVAKLFPLAFALTLDQAGNVWVAGPEIMRVSHGQNATFRPDSLKTDTGVRVIGAIEAAGADHLIVGMSIRGKGLGLLQLISGKWSSFPLQGIDPETLDVSALHYDRDGALWIGTLSQGLFHVYNGHSDHFDTTGGLSANEVDEIDEDREGNIWITTAKGVDRFRSSRVTQFSSGEGLISDTPISVAASRDGAVWVGEVGGLSRIDGGQVTRIGRQEGFPGAQVISLHEDETGLLWLGIDRSLYTYRNGRFSLVQNGDDNSLGSIVQIVEDVGGNMWLLKAGPETLVTSIAKDHLMKTYKIGDAPSFTDILAANAAGGLLIGMRGGDISRIINGNVQNYRAPKDQLAFNGILTNSDGSVWGANDDGIVLSKNGQLRKISAENGLPCRRIYSIIRDRKGSIWGAAECGVFHFAEKDLEAVAMGQQKTMRVGLLDQSDGFITGSGSFRGNLALSNDGRLWFISGSSVQMVDPNDKVLNALPPPVHVEQVIADDKTFPLAPRMVLKPLTRQIEIDYTALSLVAPQRVNFRYRLDGVDQQWHAAGTRRQAFYENLPPGNFRFHVIASNNDGLWNEVGDSFELVVKPAFYQTIWFRTLFVAAVFIGIWLFIVTRVRKATEAIQSRLAERIRERERIARELHDTLLQGFHGLILRFQVAAKLTSDVQPAHPVLNDALGRADILMTESRERIRNLRYEAENIIPLPEALASLGEELSNIAPLRFQVTVAGTSRDIVPVIRDEVYFIGREALVNAFTHSQGTNVELDIDFEESGLRMRVRDDGRGLSEQVLRSKGTEGHWGLSGMHERAENIGARLNIWNRAGSGCELELKVPANLVYQGAQVQSPWHRLRSLVGLVAWFSDDLKT